MEERKGQNECPHNELGIHIGVQKGGMTKLQKKFFTFLYDSTESNGGFIVTKFMAPGKRALSTVASATHD